MTEKINPMRSPYNEDLKNKLKERLLGREVRSMKDLCDLQKKLFQEVNISVKELQRNSPDFAENRAKLNSEPGVIIANHPGGFDGSTILSLLSRDDILMMVNEAEVYKGTNVENNFILAPHRTKEIAETFTHIKKHIQGGGIFIIFPTAGSENYDGDFKFKSGFYNMLTDGTLKKDTMIYCFNIQGEGVTIPDEEKTKRFAYFAQHTTNENDEGNKIPFSSIEISIDEQLTRGEEWLATLEKNQDKNVALGEHYLEIFQNAKLE